MQSSWHTNTASLKAHGFTGFHTIGELRVTKLSSIPEEIGVYLVIRPENAIPEFLLESTGGFFKGKNPSVGLDILLAKWVDDACVLYIGKAGSLNGAATLKSRLRQYLAFGAGKKIGHWGGRYLWHLPSSDDLIVAWKATPGVEPRDVEKQLISEFALAYGARPFANLVG